MARFEIDGAVKACQVADSSHGSTPRDRRGCLIGSVRDSYGKGRRSSSSPLNRVRWSNQHAHGVELLRHQAHAAVLRVRALPLAA